MHLGRILSLFSVAHRFERRLFLLSRRSAREDKKTTYERGFIRLPSAAMLFWLLLIEIGMIIPRVSSAANWSTWSKLPSPIFSGQHLIASDPSILVDSSLYRMSYTCHDPFKNRPVLCQALSSNGSTWSNMPGQSPISGLVLSGRDGQWDENLETSFILKRGTDYLLYYSGYRDVGSPTLGLGYPASLGVARSVDGRQFSRVVSPPILSPTPGWYDNDAIYSPTIIQEGNEFVMVYVGHCFTNCQKGYGAFLLAATSSDGIKWSKRTTPVFKASSLYPWTIDGVAEPSLVKGPDGKFYLFITGINGEEAAIGIACAPTTSGPWEVNPEPIVTSTPGRFDQGAALAPQVRIESNKVRLWYTGWDHAASMAVGYAEAPWPLK